MIQIEEKVTIKIKSPEGFTVEFESKPTTENARKKAEDFFNTFYIKQISAINAQPIVKPETTLTIEKWDSIKNLLPHEFTARDVEDALRLPITIDEINKFLATLIKEDKLAIKTDNKLTGWTVYKKITIKIDKSGFIVDKWDSIEKSLGNGFSFDQYLEELNKIIPDNPLLSDKIAMYNSINRLVKKGKIIRSLQKGVYFKASQKASITPEPPRKVNKVSTILKNWDKIKSDLPDTFTMSEYVEAANKIIEDKSSFDRKALSNSITMLRARKSIEGIEPGKYKKLPLEKLNMGSFSSRLFWNENSEMLKDSFTFEDFRVLAKDIYQITDDNIVYEILNRLKNSGCIRFTDTKPRYYIKIHPQSANPDINLGDKSRIDRNNLIMSAK